MNLSVLADVWELYERRGDIKALLACIERGEEIMVRVGRNNEVIPTDTDAGRAMTSAFTNYLTSLLTEIEAGMVKHGLEIDDQDQPEEAAA